MIRNEPSSAAPRVLVVISQGHGSHPTRRLLEQQVAQELSDSLATQVLTIPHLYDLSADSPFVTSVAATPLQLIVLTWIYPRAAYWTLSRLGVRGRYGEGRLGRTSGDAQDEDADDASHADESPPDMATVRASNDESAPNRVADHLELPDRWLYCLDLREADSAAMCAAEVMRIVGKFASSGGASGGPPVAAPIMPPSELVSLGQTPEQSLPRRWYPVIDFSRCTNCMECIDFCLFGVYGVDQADTILVEQPDNCRKGCPACSRVCPENAIIFPLHKSPVIAGAAGGAESLKIDLSALFGAPSAKELAAQERDEQLLAAGRVAASPPPLPDHGTKHAAPRDELDTLMDQFDKLEL